MNSANVQGVPADIVRASDYAQLATDKLDSDMCAYINGGAGDELTLADNQSAFDRIRILPKVLQDFATAGTRCTVLEQTLSAPLLLGPVAFQKLVHPEGELASVAAADALGCGFVTSTLSSYPLEQIALGTESIKWFQLYWQPQRDDVLALARRAEHSGYQALVVTVDAPVTALRYREQRSGFSMPADIRAVNLDGVAQPLPIIDDGESPVLNGVMACSPRWEDLVWLREHTTLPIILKGILHPDDAKTAMTCGMDGVIVSNHGGRSLDGVPATISMLADVRAAVGDAFTVLLDGGIRRGSDVFKALALGADAVLVGRLQIQALAVAGALGVAHMLRLLLQELEVTMALAGCPTITAIDASKLRVNSID